MRRALVAVALIGLFAGGCAEAKPEAGVRAEPKDTKLGEAYTHCQPISGVITLADGNSSIIISGAKSDDIADVACLMLQLDTPEYIVSAMDNTTAMMGAQQEEADGISYRWSYHPDNGLDMTLHET